MGRYFLISYVYWSPMNSEKIDWAEGERKYNGVARGCFCLHESSAQKGKLCVMRKLSDCICVFFVLDINISVPLESEIRKLSKE